MNARRISSWLLALLLFALPLSLSAQSVQDVSGTYTDNFGQSIVLFQSGTTVTGPRSAGGTVTATLSGSTLSGAWTDASGSSGHFVWTFASDSSSFTGTFGYGSDGSSGGSWNGTLQPGVISVRVTPGPTSFLQMGTTAQFTALVAGTSDKRVTWSLNGAGSVDATGLFSAPSTAGSSVITATSVADTNVSASSSACYTPDGYLDVSGTYSDNFGVGFTLFQQGSHVWGLRPSSGHQQAIDGTLSGSALTGTLRDPSGDYVNFAWSFALDGSSYTGSYGFGSSATNGGAWDGTRQAGVSVQLSPLGTTLQAGGTAQFSALVAGSSDKRVTWSLTGEGSVDATGLFTAPSHGGTSTLTATSVADASASGTGQAIYTLDGLMDVSGTYNDIYGTAFTLFQSGSHVYGTRTYGTTPGTISATLADNQLTGTLTNPDGSYINFLWTFAPDAMSYTGSFGFGGSTSGGGAWNGARQAGVVTMKLTPVSSILQVGGSSTFIPILAGTPDKRVTWTATSGSVDANGTFTAPAIPGYATVTATSVSNSNASVSATTAFTADGYLDVSGTYSDVYGTTFTLFQQGTHVWGTRIYSALPQTLDGTISGYVLTGTCTSQDGTVLNFVWTFAPDTSSFNGTCGTDSGATNGGAWTGTKHVGQLTMVLTPTESHLKLGASQPFSVLLAGTPDKRLSWSVVDGPGSIDGNGIFTAGSAPGGVSHVLVQSVVDSSVSQSATLSASWDGSLDISGSYTDNSGNTLVLYQNGASIYGTRAVDGLILQGVLVGRQLVGIWTSGNGSNYGDLSWTFTPDGMSYSGLFSENKETVLGRSWSGARQPGVVSVLMRPSVSVLPPSWSQNFTAQVAGSYDKRVNWSVQETGGGSVNTGGVYTAPAAQGTYHLVASALVAPSATATAAIEVRVNDLQVAPSAIALRAAATAKFQATLQGTPATAVTWSVQEAGGGSISSAGLYTAPLTAGVYHVQATSTVDGTQTATAEISVRSDAALSVSISPDTTTLGLGSTSSFVATVDGSSYQAVTWTTTGGTIDSTGHYTAPNAYGTYTVTATSIDDPTASDTATVVVSSGLATDKTFIYDANGNLIDDGTRQFKYDAENRLIAVIENSHGSVFTYDGLGRRVEIVEKDQGIQQSWSVSNDTKYVWEGAEILESRSVDGGTTLQRYYAQGFVDTDGTDLYYTKDHLGSTRELVDYSGVARARYDYDPWGRATKLGGDRDSVFLYTGHFSHRPSGLYLTLYRAYDPSLARWINRDPLQENGGINAYVYVNNNSVELIDKFGLKPQKLLPSQCDFIKKLLDSENTIGTSRTAQRYLLSDAVVSAPADMPEALIQTSDGPMDLAWFIQLAAGDDSSGLGVDGSYWARRPLFTGSYIGNYGFKLMDNYIQFENPFYPDPKWEWPFETDPGELLALESFKKGRSFHDLFPPSVFNSSCCK